MKRKLRQCAAALLCGLTALALAACQENPEGSIVAHKDMDKLISQAADTGSQAVPGGQVAEEARQAETYQAEIRNEALGMEAIVNAQVEVPEAAAFSVYRVEQRKFDQAFVDQVRAELMGDAPLYEGAVLEKRTKPQIEAEIGMLREEVANYEAQMKGEPSISEEERAASIEAYRAETQESIDRLQAEYESAPVEIDLTPCAIDGRLHTVKEMHDQNPEDDFYTWLYSLSDDGDEVCYGVTDGSDGQYRILYVQNNADYSNKLTFRSCPAGHCHFGGVVVGGTLMEDETVQTTQAAYHYAGIPDIAAYWQEKGVPAPVLTDRSPVEPDEEYEAVHPAVTISQEEAEETAEAFLAQMGLEGFVLSEGGRYSEMVRMVRWEEKTAYANYYILQYVRQIDEVPLTQSSGGKFAASWDSGGNFNKQLWPGELIEFRVNDSGIVGFDYHAPLTVTETVVEGAAMKPFEEVKAIFEQMLPVILGSTEEQRRAEIDRVALSYSRISEKDSFDTGLVVPVWSFEGEVKTYDEKNEWQVSSGTLMAINAIDGSVIDAALGY